MRRFDARGPAGAGGLGHLGTLLKMDKEVFEQLGRVPAEILYDRMKTVWLDADERDEMFS